MASLSLHNKVALVTGGSRGIGAGIVLDFAKRGASVAFNYNKSAKEAEAIVAQIKKNGGNAIAVQADVSNLADIDRLFKETIAAFGKIHIVVNNAGILAFETVADLTEEAFDKVFAVNTKGPFFVGKQAAKLVVDGGRIINISTGLTSAYGAIGLSAYAASKAAVEVLTRALAKELGPRNITVNTVSPGFTTTDMSSSFPRELGSSASVLNRWGEVEDITNVVSFVASDEGRWLTGQNISASGGVTMTL